jgi:hypothetical protein
MSVCGAQAQTLTVAQDSFTDRPTSAQTNGANAVIKVSEGGGKNGFIQFDVSALRGQAIASATLEIDVAQIWRDDGGTVELRLVESAWSEDTLTFDNQPAFSAPLATLPVFEGDVGGTVSVGITSIVRGWVDGTVPNYGLALTSSRTDRINVRLYSNTASIDVRLDNELNITPAQLELRWLPPSTRSDGSALSLSEIGGYILQVNGTVFSDDISAQAVALTVGNLLPGDYCFEIATRDIEGRIGPFSNANCWSVVPVPAQP